ncbi:MAG TPA: hypothetical protein VLA64_05575, partial [Azonexus sp.]|nr:hypothetical protein [Azonexus sp.]
MSNVNVRKMMVGAGVIASLFAGGAHAELLDLTGQGYYTYGNTNSYSLPILAYQYDLQNGGGTGPGNPYYVVSTPGAIQDLVVIYTGSSGQGVTTNTAGFEDAYQTPSGSTAPFATTTNASMVAPTGTESKGIATIYSTTWDANVSSLVSFLGGGDPLFLFNNNDTNQDQHLAIWAKLWLTGPDGGDLGTDPDVYNNRYLYLSNTNAVYGQGGIPLGDATTYNPGNVNPAVNPLTGQTDYVLSGGNICVSKTNGAVVDLAECSGANKNNFDLINHNLGANQAAYAGSLPLLNQWLAALKASGEDLSLYSLHMQLNLGCDSAWTLNNQGNCSVGGVGID